MFSMLRLFALAVKQRPGSGAGSGPGALLPSRRGALQLAMRAGWLAVTSAQLWSAEDGDGPGASGYGDSASGLPDETAEPAFRLARKEVARTAVESLMTAWELLTARVAAQSPAGAGPVLPARPRAHDVAAWWRLNVAVAAHVTPHCCAADEPPAIAELLDVGNVARTELPDFLDPLSLPDAPPGGLEDALRAGLLPCLEALLRAAGREPRGRAADVVGELLGQRSGDSWRLLAALLAYGEERQAAALVVTLGKLVQRTDPRAIAEVGARNDSYLRLRLMIIVALFAESPVARTGPRAESGGEAQGTDEPEQRPPEASSASAQLVRLLSLAACTILPAISRLAMQAAAHVRTVGDAERVADLLTPVLFWIPCLATRCGLLSRRGGPPAAAGPPNADSSGADFASSSAAAFAGAAIASGGGGRSGAAGCAGVGDRASAAAAAAAHAAIGGAAGGDGGACVREEAFSWRSFLLEEVGAVELVTAALALAEVMPPDRAAGQCPWFMRKLATSCLALAGLGPAVYCPSASPVAAGAEADAAAVESPTPGRQLAWPPKGLAALAAALGRLEGDLAVGMEEQAACLQHLGAAGGGSSPAVGGRVTIKFALSDPLPLAVALLPPPVARSLLRVCANPVCANLEGDSEAALRLQACGRCGAAHYCRRACLQEHWRAGHREACRKAGAGSERGRVPAVDAS
ncbi:hypothetical protein GPECTOR_27g680 [Gonium pectorale]|uniref:phytol kinase n=1 Tax=Gonium pectorale TaxID=33097 RepID=A0A150GF77_GONPE|nr:hypothetical protein GPECTOR_27g680 [Gonium pectorale]|eukprot:KXZ48509.1 hypothetical protein GPECTOR_27g680 [Gonium pectorale]